MPVRKIPKNYTTVTGLASSVKSEELIGYEGRLEYYFIKLVSFNNNVLRCEEQPVKITFTGSDGKQHSYTPDALITYRQDVDPAKQWKPLLVEIKPRRWLSKNWRELHPKFRAARHYATQMTLDFSIITEHEIVNPYLKNVQFLIKYRTFPTDSVGTKLLLNALKDLQETDVKTLLLSVSDNQNRSGELLPTLWQLVANFTIEANLEEPLTMGSRLRLFNAPDGGDCGERIYKFSSGHAHGKRWQALRYLPPSGP
jgi:TnsA endonuclease N terminal/TnsA endonuclease C terminal